MTSCTDELFQLISVLLLGEDQCNYCTYSIIIIQLLFPRSSVALQKISDLQKMLNLISFQSPNSPKVDQQWREVASPHLRFTFSYFFQDKKTLKTRLQINFRLRRTVCEEVPLNCCSNFLLRREARIPLYAPTGRCVIFNTAQQIFLY